jgi:hypothetical protein
MSPPETVSASPLLCASAMRADSCEEVDNRQDDNEEQDGVNDDTQNYGDDRDHQRDQNVSKHQQSSRLARLSGSL